MKLIAGLLQGVISNLAVVKIEINDLLASVTGKPVQEIQDMSLVDYTALIVAFFKKPELADFFKSIASLLK
ncbi:MAG: hypothetical protein LBT80_09695 [Lactobacillaceae bacterium]|jgi:hypothetical protein|nr:hypothetical protein [Lactobacillaceae bacterium]